MNAPRENRSCPAEQPPQPSLGAEHDPQSLGQDEQVSPDELSHVPLPQIWVTHCPALHASPDGHCPHVPPQPSPPHSVPEQLGLQQEPELHTWPCEQQAAPQVA